MKRALKWFGIVIGGLVGLIVLIALGLYAKSRLEFGQRFAVQVESVNVPTDAASIEHGKHLATVLCMECHGRDLGGNPNFLPPSPLGAAVTPNLTTGAGGLGATFTNADFVRVLRHGVKPDGRSVFVMPSQAFWYLSDKDLGDLIAYVRSVPAVDRDTPEPHISLSLMGNLMYGAGMLGNALRASVIDQTRHPAAPAVAITREYGEYLVHINGCRDCHGTDLAGGKPGDPSAPLAPNLTPGGELSAWTEPQFLTALRTGVKPDGAKLKSYMPWEFKGQMTDDELQAIWAYLKSLPALPTSTAQVK